MKKKKISCYVVVCCLTFFTFWFSGCQKKPGQTVLNTPHKVVDSFGKQREYRLFYPIVNSGFRVPLLVYFHGVRSECFKQFPGLRNYTGSPVEETGLIEFCKNNNIALLVPEPAYEYKFHNCMCKGWSPFDKELDGVEKMIDLVVEKYSISEKRIFLSGLSAGAAFCFHIANRKPERYNSILSHGQGSLYEDLRYLMPTQPGPKFGVLLAYTKGDYKNLIEICQETEKIYKENNYKVLLLKDLPPENHRWSETSNELFWKYLNELGQYTTK